MKKSNKRWFKGKEVLLFGLIALVITAGYYRWTVEQQQLVGYVEEEAIPTVSEQDGQGNTETQENTDSEISKLKQERDSARSQSVEEWKKIATSNETSQEGKKDAEKKIANATESADKERNIETMVKAKGFDDCIAYVDEGGVSVTVKGGEIDGSKVAQIKDIVVTETGVSPRNIKINAM